MSTIVSTIEGEGQLIIQFIFILPSLNLFTTLILHPIFWSAELATLGCRGAYEVSHDEYLGGDQDDLEIEGW
jgi:hypothetical protein